MLLLALAGVTREEIAADYALSAERLPARHAARGEDDPGPAIDAYLADRGTAAVEQLHVTLDAIDVEICLLNAGLACDDVAAVRRWLLDP